MRKRVIGNMLDLSFGGKIYVAVSLIFFLLCILHLLLMFRLVLGIEELTQIITNGGF